VVSLIGIYFIHPIALQILEKTKHDADRLRWYAYGVPVVFGTSITATFLLMALAVHHFLGLLYLIAAVAGVSLASLLLRVSGGVFTAAADIGATLVEQENPKVPEEALATTYLNQLGDHVRDLCGFVLDAVSSLLVVVLAGMMLMSGHDLENISESTFRILSLIPWGMPSLGLLSAWLGGLVGLLLIALRRDGNVLMNGLYATLLLGAVAVGLVFYGDGFQVNGSVFLSTLPDNLFIPVLGLLGIVGGGLIGFGCEWYTSARYRPVKKPISRKNSTL
jgi:Na+/H+-translocating membrane pyrophosphatase